MARRHAFHVNKLFKTRLAPTPLAGDVAEYQAAIDAAVFAARSHRPRKLQSGDLTAVAAATHMRRCLAHNVLLPNAFMVKFVAANRPDGEVVLVADPSTDRLGKGLWVSACHATVSYLATTKYRVPASPSRRPVAGGAFTRALPPLPSLSVRPDLAIHTFHRHNDFLHSLIRHAMLRQRCVGGAGGVQRHVAAEAAARGRRGDPAVVRAVDMSQLALLLPVRALDGTAPSVAAVAQLAAEVDNVQFRAGAPPVTVAPSVVDWGLCGAPDTPPPSVIAFNGDALSRRVFFTALRVQGLLPATAPG